MMKVGLWLMACILSSKNLAAITARSTPSTANVCGECLLTTSMLHDFNRNKALEDSECATGWKATYNKNQGFSDDAVDAWLSIKRT